jgi:hypothetical protein
VAEAVGSGDEAGDDSDKVVEVAFGAVTGAAKAATMYARVMRVMMEIFMTVLGKERTGTVCLNFGEQAMGRN